MKKTNTMLDHALALAKLGFRVIPVTPMKKRKPLRKAFWRHASRLEERIRRLWRKRPNANPAISTTRFKGGHLIVIDVDPKHGGFNSLEGLKLIEGYDFPETYEQHTPSGGVHLVYYSPVPCALSAGELGAGLDIRSYHGYILGAGAQTAAGVYTNRVRPVAPAPKWLHDWALAHPPATKPSRTESPASVDRVRALKQAHAYLTKLAPAPDGQRDAVCYKAACKLRGFGLSQADTLDQIVTWFKADPGTHEYTDADKAHAVNSAFQYAKGEAGEEAPVDAGEHFAPIEDEEAPESASMEPETASNDDLPPEGSLLNHLNRDYAAMMVGSKFRVMWEKLDHHGHATREFLATQDFKDRLAGQYMDNQDGSKKVELSTAWLRWRNRRSYDGLVFAPGRKLPPRFYNTWRGFAYEPLARNEVPTPKMKEALDMYLTHLRHNFCAGNAAYTKYVTAFFAHMIQKPDQKPRVAIVAKGGKGIGKSTIAQMQGALVEPHFFVAADDRFLLGNFNSHMGDTSFFVLEEAVWGGNKNAESMLKDLVTRGHINVEQKFREVFRADNYMRIMIIGNEDWQVPASLKDERRWAVFNVVMNTMPMNTEKEKIKVANWFDRLYTLMKEGGYRYLMTYLQNFDLEGVNINAAPITEGLIEQIRHTLSPLHQWWLECLEDGRIVDSGFGVKSWPRDILKEDVRDAFTRYCARRNIDGRLPSAVSIGRDLHRVCPSIRTDKKNRDNDWIYRLPPLSVARAEWGKILGRAPVWPDDVEI